MKRQLIAFVALISVLVVVSGCGSQEEITTSEPDSSTASEAAEGPSPKTDFDTSSGAFVEAFVGEWELANLAYENGDDPTDDMKYINSLGVEESLTLNADGTGHVSTVFADDDFTWFAQEENKGTVVAEGVETPIELRDGSLYFEGEATDGSRGWFIFERKGDLATV